MKQLEINRFLISLMDFSEQNRLIQKVCPLSPFVHPTKTHEKKKEVLSGAVYSTNPPNCTFLFPKYRLLVGAIHTHTSRILP